MTLNALALVRQFKDSRPTRHHKHTAGRTLKAFLLHIHLALKNSFSHPYANKDNILYIFSTVGLVIMSGKSVVDKQY